MATLSADEIERLVYAARKRSDVSGTPLNLSSLLGLLDDAKRCALAPRVNGALVERLVALLRAPPFDVVDDGRTTVAECFRLLCTALLNAGRTVDVQVCTVRADARSQRPAAPGSADDTAIRVGCDDGAGRDYHAKTDLRTVWVSQALLGKNMRTEPLKTRHGDALVESLALLMILHEFAHVYISEHREAFAPLEAIYKQARDALAAQHGSVASDENDMFEFLAETFAYENARTDRSRRRVE